MISIEYKKREACIPPFLRRSFGS